MSDHKKKKTTRYQEQEEQRVAAYQEQIKDIPPEKIAYVDECGIDTYLYREYGYASRGQQVFGRISGRRYQRCGIVAAKMGHQIIAPFQYSGTMDSRLFDFWFSHQLLPSLDKGTVIVMDNASFHSKCESRVEQELGKSGSNAAKDMTKQARQGADQGGGLDVR